MSADRGGPVFVTGNYRSGEPILGFFRGRNALRSTGPLNRNRNNIVVLINIVWHRKIERRRPLPDPAGRIVF